MIAASASSRSAVSARALGTGRAISELTVIFVRASESAALNRRYRHRAYAANVLSFGYGGSGEIVIAPEVIRREARAAGRPFHVQLRHMVVHGFMHLAGIHHQGSLRRAARFERVERRILEQLNIE